MEFGYHPPSGYRGFDLAVLTFPQFQELDDMRPFVDEVMPAFSWQPVTACGAKSRRQSPG